MIITILSGKGGTGKTTVSTNLAKVLSENLKVQLLDADVEEPNDHIFFNAGFSQTESVNILLPVVDESRCIQCGECAKVCQFGAIALFSTGVKVFETLCHGCGACSIACPVDAISEKPKEIGKVKIGTVNATMNFGMGILNIGEPSGVRIIRQLKKHIDRKVDVVLIDSSPGTSCPVVESLREADFAILVTEPTTFGLHDLKLATDLVKEMNIPAGIVINRDNEEVTIIDDFAKEADIPIILRIPFDREIATLYSRGELFVEHLPKWKKRFFDAFETIKGLIK
ncbi:MAG: ATP-binding protein [Thermotogae bacterium]|nr:ATP-binding protein [Thermotogota bacterium]